MSRVLVTGANGFIGRALCRQLAADGYEVVAATRASPAETLAGRPFVAGEIGPDTEWRVGLDNVWAVIHLAARVHIGRDAAADPLVEFRRVNAAGTRRLADSAAACGVKRFVFVSTAKVLGEESPRPFGDDDKPAPQGPYAVSKWEAERALAEISGRTGLAVTVVRPPLVYGPGVGANFLDLLRLCDTPWPLPLGGIDNRRSLLYLGNLVSALARSLGTDKAVGRTWLIGDGEDLSTSELVKRLREALGRPARLFAAPAASLRLAGAIAGRGEAAWRLTGSLALDPSSWCATLAWTPPFSVREGLDATAAWYKENRSLR
ncbi:MAG: NAD-dependent epimerase/dehydratase family protein [Pseudomonadota bacterium]